MPKTLLAETNDSIAQFQETVGVKLAKWTTARTPQAFSGVEQEAHGAARKLADDIVAGVLREILADVAFQAQCLAGAHSVGAYKSKGFKDTTVTLLGGNSYPIRTQYLLPPASKGRRARRRRGVGLWPCLVALGIWWHSSPALAGEVAHQIADSCSFRDGLEALKRRGIALGYKRTLALYQKFSQRAAEQRDAWIDKMVNAGSTGWADNGPLKGKTVLVSTDGGRCRERRAKRGRRLANGHHRYYTPWREPKELVIYVLDDEGRPDRKWLPIYDGTMGDCDDIFCVLSAKVLDLNPGRMLGPVLAPPSAPAQSDGCDDGDPVQDAGWTG